MSKTKMLVILILVLAFVASYSAANPIAVPASKSLSDFFRSNDPGSYLRSKDWGRLFLESIQMIGLVLLIVISCLETWVLRRFVKCKRFTVLLSHVFLINALTSLIGVFFWPKGIDLTIAASAAFVITALIEGGLMVKCRTMEDKPARSYFTASFQMNAASYLLIYCVMRYISS